MKLLVLPAISLFLFLSAFADELQKDEKWVTGYFNELRKTYDKRVAPVGEKGPGSAIKVGISMFIMDISEVDDSSMDYTAQFYFRQIWNDSRLRYTDRTEVISVRDTSEIWTPDLFFTLGREGRQEQIVHPNAFIKIKPSGEVFWSIRVTVKFSCPMDLRYFPHDIQKCEMLIESYAHVKKDIELEWFQGPIGASGTISLHNFELIDLDQSQKVVNLTSGEYKVLIVNLTLQRRFGFFAIKLYVPFILLVILSLLSLWIKAEERGLRLSLLVLILYFMTNIAVEISSSIPPAPYTKGTDVWIGFCESLVFAIFLEFIAVALIAGRHDGEIAESKGEILLNIETGSKDQPMKGDTLKSHLCKLVNMFDARNGGKGKRDTTAHRVDKIFRIVFPFIFILFNVVYWSVYCCKSTE